MIQTTSPHLLSSVQLGDLSLPNRVVLAPLTRSRAGESRIPNDLMATYYTQRASAGLIISEATMISAQAIGWSNSHGIYNEEQIEGWKGVVEAIHAKGGHIFLQLWHMGRASHSSFQINTKDSTNQYRNLFIEYGNHSQLSTATCGIDCLNDTVLLFSNSTTPTISIAPTYPDNTTKIATTSFVSSAITNINPAIRYPPTNSNTLNINNTISLTDGTATNTLNQSDWTGTIKSVYTAADVTHFLNFSNSSGTGQGHPQKNSNLSCNPFLSKITATTFEGTATASDTISLSSDNTSGTYFIPFSKTADTSGNKLFIDNVTGPLSYDPSTSTLNCTNLSGTANIANNVALTPANDNVTCFIPF